MEQRWAEIKYSIPNIYPIFQQVTSLKHCSVQTMHHQPIARRRRPAVRKGCTGAVMLAESLDAAVRARLASGRGPPPRPPPFLAV